MSATPEEYQKGLNVTSTELQSSIVPTISEQGYAPVANKRGLAGRAGGTPWLFVSAMHLRRWAGRFNCSKGFDNLVTVP